jgi:hypothetical protein
MSSWPSCLRGIWFDFDGFRELQFTIAAVIVRNQLPREPVAQLAGWKSCNDHVRGTDDLRRNVAGEFIMLTSERRQGSGGIDADHVYGRGRQASEGVMRV